MNVESEWRAFRRLGWRQFLRDNIYGIRHDWRQYRAGLISFGEFVRGR